MIGTMLSGRYRLESKLGSGGMSTVYLAVDETLGRHVAIKVLHQEISDQQDQLERFRREARAVAQLSHPNLVGVIDAGEEGGRPFIVFHDGYQYVERAFDLPAAGSVALHDGDAPGTARIAGVRDRVIADAVVCAFAEPEFPPALLETVIDGTPARAGRLDGIGAGLAPGPDLYPALLDGLADGLEACLLP